MEQYRLTFETVATNLLHKYCNEDPMYYSKATQLVPNSKIPEEDWHKVSKITEDPWDQYNTLKQWVKDDKDFVRNVVLEKMVNKPTWEIVEEKEFNDTH